MFPVTTHSEAETAAVAQRLATTLHRGACITLSGEVGVGKTVFARALIRALAGEAVTVHSPTFTLVQTYPVVLADGTALTLWHYDLYRVKSSAELMELALDEALDDGVVLMEWPEVAEDYLPAHTLHLSIDAPSEHERVISARQSQ